MFNTGKTASRVLCTSEKHMNSNTTFVVTVSSFRILSPKCVIIVDLHLYHKHSVLVMSIMVAAGNII